MKHLIRIIAFATIVILLALVMVAFAPAQAPATSAKYTPTEVQALRLKVAQQAAQIAQRDLQDAQTRFQTALASLREEGERVKAESKWPKDVVFDWGTLTFNEAPAAPATPKPAPEAKKP